MKTSNNNFDLVAPFYDFLAKTIFGKTIQTAQTHFLHHIPDNAKILILGGGSGWILKEIFALKNSCRILYIEKSKKMIALSKKRLTNLQLEQVVFAQDMDTNTNQVFDVIITNFFLDVFEKKELKDVMKLLRGLLSKEGVWLFTDFQHQNIWWQKILLKLMFTFFRLFASLESKQLYDFEELFDGFGMTSLKSKSFFHKMIISNVYRKGMPSLPKLAHHD